MPSPLWFMANVPSIPSIPVLAVDPQWWWSVVFMPAMGGLGWLAKYAFDRRQADRSEGREERTEEWGRITQTNQILATQVSGLEAKVAQFDPTLAQVQKEYRDTLTREMEVMGRYRDLRIEHDELKARFVSQEREIASLAAYERENKQLRTLLVDQGVTDNIPRHGALPWEGPVTAEQIAEPPLAEITHGPHGEHESRGDVDDYPESGDFQD